MDAEDAFLYRGTTLGWPGTAANRFLPMTCTSSDPYVATCFALECSGHGRSVVQMARRPGMAPFIGEANPFDRMESAVNLAMPPSRFDEFVVITIDAQSARTILVELGFHEIPYLIHGLASLHDELKLSYLRGDRLSPSQRSEFDQLASWRAL